MVRTNRNQRLAIKRIFDRGPMYHCAQCPTPIPYREFRKSSVMGTFGMGGAVVVRWAGMYIAIERDGYAHT
jgi:hypothetical protein